MATLHGKTALVAGAGALGAPAALALAASGVARRVLEDGAVVGPGDLVGHPLLRGDDLGAPRAVAVARRLAGLFPAIADRE
jgi:molybdopterin/thiamine biosynthesis adenylyltransferase